jgi:hypothetical protein
MWIELDKFLRSEAAMKLCKARAEGRTSDTDKK